MKPTLLLAAFLIGLPLATSAEPIVDLAPLLASGRYVSLDDALTPLATVPNDLPSRDALQAALDQLAPPRAADVRALDAWVGATGSGVARLVRGEFYLARAWKARGTRFASQTAPDAMERMEQLMAAAGTDFEAALAMLGDACDACQAGRLTTLLATGGRHEAAAQIDRVLLALHGGIETPLAWLNFLHPNWSGRRGEGERFIAQFAVDFPDSPAVRLMRSAQRLERGIELLYANQPAQARVVLDEAVHLNPRSWRAWERLASAAVELGQNDVALIASERALAIRPDEVAVLETRSYVLRVSGRPLDAVPLLERAVALGSDWALQELLPMVAAGRGGYPADRARAEKICQSAIDADLPSGFACMGGLHYFGMGRPADKPRAFQYFVEAAQRGVAPAMVDAGLMLARGDGVAAEPRAARHYLLRGLKAGEPRADRHLRETLSGWEYFRYVTLPALASAAQGVVLAALAVLIPVLWLTPGWLVRNGQGGPARQDGARRVLYPNALLVNATRIMLGVTLAFCAVVLLVPQAVERVTLVAAALALLLVSCRAWQVFLCRVSFDGGAVYRSAWPFKTSRMHSHRMAGVGWSGWRAEYFVESHSGRRIYFSGALEGSGELLEWLRPAPTGFYSTQPA